MGNIREPEKNVQNAHKKIDAYWGSDYGPEDCTLLSHCAGVEYEAAPLRIPIDGRLSRM